MTQEAVVEHQPEPPTEEVHEALMVCSGCSHIVPKTMVCIYCGNPILFTQPAKTSP
ncbi:hypothetical protein ISS40_06280 [Candidatus Bathyarchaeota archaeon]|nr:hypothetical protein [Candidatus Bathyarchaeota archaeon]MBL7168263.1 hypothetical protein [Candidatus Bathyarchaeota archaeon]